MLIVTSAFLTSLLAQAGSGSSGFSGGGSSGGGGGYSGGGSSGGGYSGGGGSSGGSSSGGGAGNSFDNDPLVLVLLGGLAIAVLLYYALPPLFAMLSAARSSRRQAADDGAREQRDAEVRSAALVAVEDDAKFDATELLAHVADLVVIVQDSWSNGDRSVLAEFLGEDLLVEWCRRLDDFEGRGWHNRVLLQGDAEARLISITNRADDGDDRAVVHVRVPMDSWVETPEGSLFPNGQNHPRIELSEYWTLAWREGIWILISIEQDGEGGHHLTAPLVLAPDQDPELAATVRTELAVDDAAGDGGAVAALVSTSLSGDARAAALDLSLVDDRFSPDVLTIAVDRAIAAWAEAIDGSDAALERLAEPDAIQTLLYGDDTSERTRTVIRGPRVEEVTIEHVSGGDGEVAIMDVALRYRARWYREDRDTVALIAGSKDRETERRAHWTFVLSDDPGTPWMLTLVGV